MEAQGIIYIETPDGNDHCWEVAVHPFYDSPATLKAHFEAYKHRWPVDSAFVGAEIWRFKR